VYTLVSFGTLKTEAGALRVLVDWTVNNEGKIKGMRRLGCTEEAWREKKSGERGRWLNRKGIQILPPPAQFCFLMKE
jgi:hypothetical protein